MSHNDITSSNTKESFREEAEKIFKNKHSKLLNSVDILLSEDVKELIHELQVHQVELEMQKDELLIAQAELKESNARYFDL